MTVGFKLTEGGKDECMLECELDWRHGKGQKVSITVKTPGPDFDVEVRSGIHAAMSLKGSIC